MGDLVKCALCGKPMKREDVASLYIEDGIRVGTCKNCDVDANDLTLIPQEVSE